MGGAPVAPVASLASGIAADYDIKTVNGAWSITPLGMTLTAGSYGPAAYDGSTHAPSVCSSDAPTFVTCTNSPSPVGPDFGSGAVSPTPVYGKGNATDYNITGKNGAWSITPLAVTVTGGSYTGVYDGSTHALSACTSSASTFVTCTNSPLGPLGPDVGGAAVNPTSVLVKGIVADYTITPANGAWSITKAPSTTTITPSTVNATYDGLAHGVTASVTGAGGLNQSVPVTYTAGGSSAPVNPGTYTANASYAGDQNHLPSNATPVTIAIIYGNCSAAIGPGQVILPPINSDGTSVYKRQGGSTIPVKFRACSASGASISNPSAVFAGTGGPLTMLSAVRGTVDAVNETTTGDIPDAAFRWDSSGQQWIFNMATTNLTSGNTYTFTINLAYGKITFVVGVK